MEVIEAIIQAILFLFGIYEEHAATREQCEQMWQQGYVVYPLSDQELERAKQCAELQPG